MNKHSHIRFVRKLSSSLKEKKVQVKIFWKEKKYLQKKKEKEIHRQKSEHLYIFS